MAIYGDSRRRLAPRGRHRSARYRGYLLWKLAWGGRPHPQPASPDHSEDPEILRRRDGFDLLDVVPVVSRHGFHDGLKRHGAALGMRHWSGQIGRFHGLDQRYVPGAHSRQRRQRQLGIARRITFRPQILIEGLDDVMILSQSLLEAEAEHNFGVGQMGNDIASAPLTGSGRSFQAPRTDGFHQLRQAARRL